MELEAKVGFLSTSDDSETESGTSPPEEDGLGTGEEPKHKAQSASPSGDFRKPSYRQYLRQKRSRSKENPGGQRSASAERPGVSVEVSPDDDRNVSQVRFLISGRNGRCK